MDGDFQIGEWVISPTLNSFRRNGETVHLEPKVMQVLLCLAERGEVVSKEKLMRTVWPDTFVTDDVLTRSISELRKVFADNPREPRFIQTIPKSGYLLLPSVERLKSAPKLEPPITLPPPPPSEKQRGKSTRRILTVVAMVLAALLLATYVIRARNSSPPMPARVMLAVLPFHDLSNDPEQTYFANGLTAEMISQIGQLPSERLGVIAWNSMSQYRATNKSADQIGQELGANYLLDGTVRRSGDQVRITVELLQAGKRDHLWSDSYDGTLQDVLSLQNRVAREIAREIRIQLTPGDEQRLATAASLNGEGYDVYLRAKSEAHGGQMQTKTAHLQQAIQLNPGYSPPYVEMADTLRYQASTGTGDPKTSYAAARSLLEKALQLDPGSFAAHREMAWIHWRYDWDFAAAEKEFRIAIDGNPNDAVSRDEYELFLKSMGRFDEALVQSLRHRELSPRDFMGRTNLGSLLGWMHRYDDATQVFAEALKIDPQQPYTYERMGPVLLQQGRTAEAIAALEKARDYSGGQQDKLAWLGYAYAVTGRNSEALAVLEQLKKLSDQHQYVSPLHVALVYVGLGQEDQVFKWLEKAYQARDEYLVYLKTYPEFQHLRSRSQFQDLERRIGL